MRAFTRVKVINGREYLYEITPYYDPVLKRNKQRSKYLGKNVDGKPVRMRRSVPRNIYHYGEFIPLLDTVKTLNIMEILEKYLPLDKARMLLLLSFNRVVRPMPFYRAQSWYETTMFEKEWGLDLAGPRISELLAMIGRSSIPELFSNRLMEQDTPNGTLVYDLTSLYSYSKTISLLDYGYKREHTGTRQVNLSLVMDKEKMVPLLYDVYPGSITDVTTLLGTVKKLNAMGIRDYTLVLDRGFFSTSNIDELIENHVKFVIPATFQLKAVKHLVSKAHKTTSNPNNLHMYGKEPVFVENVELELGEHLLKGYCYYSLKKDHNEEDSFYHRLHDLKERLERVELRKWMKPYHVFHETCKDLAPYFTWKVVDHHFHVSIKKNSVAQHVNKMGMYILFTNDDLSWDACLATYKSRDLVEKEFDLLKNDLETKRLNVQKENTLRGLLFVNFLSLILKMRLLHQMRQTGLLKHYTIESLLFELEKIKKIELEDGTMITTPLTKTQKNILEPLGL